VTRQSDQYREHATQAHVQAAKAQSQYDKDAWLEIASEWLQLAQNEDDRFKSGHRP
jgi:hypothetical protein